MKLICEGLDLSDAVLKVIKATATRTTNPILEGIKLTASEDTLVLSATDLEISIEKTIPADVKIEGEVVVPGKIFADFIKKLSNEQIELSVTNQNTLKIKYTDSEGYLTCMPAEEFPVIKQFTESDNFTLSKFNLRDCINKTIFAAAIDDSRPILKGCQFIVENNQVTVVALDGFRVAKVAHNILSATNNLKFVIPARTLGEIAKLIDGDDEEITVYLSNTYMMVTLGTTKIITRRLEGDFIDYAAVFITNPATTIIVNKKQLEYAIERASLLSRQINNNSITFDIKDKLLTVNSNSDLGNVTENLTINLEGKDLVIGFNARYISDCLRNIDEEYIKIGFMSSIYPCSITSPDNDSYNFVVFPVRLYQ